MNHIGSLLLSIVSVVVFSQTLAAQTNDVALTLIGRVPLEGVAGRLDHMAVDPVSQRLFISALENHTIEVIDLTQQKRIHQIRGIMEPQGLVFVAGADCLVVCSRGDGTCRSFDGRTFEAGPWVDLGRNADNVRFSRDTIYAGSGAEPGPGMMSAIDMSFLVSAGQGGRQAPPLSPADLLLDRPRQAEVKFETQLKAHPESFQIDPDRNQIFVNVPDEHQIAVLESTPSGLKLSQSWPVTVAEKNFAMALDATNAQLFVGCRKPACLVVYDTRTGKLLGQSPCVGDVDDMFYNPQTRRLYLIGGEGFVDVFQTSENAGELTRLARTTTGPKARTGLLIPETKTLAVAVPKSTNGPSMLLLYRVGSRRQELSAPK